MWRAVNPDGSLAYTFIETRGGDPHLRRDPRRRRRALPLRRAADGLQRARARSGRAPRAVPAPRRARRPPWRGVADVALRVAPAARGEAGSLLTRAHASSRVTVGGLVLLVPPYFLQGTIPPIAGRAALHARSSSRDATSTSARAATPATASRCARFKTETGPLRRPSRWPARASTTGRSCGARGARARTSRASAASTRTPGTGSTSPIRAAIEPRSNMPAFAFLTQAAARSLAHAAQARGAAQPRALPTRDAEIARRGRGRAGAGRPRSPRRCARTASRSTRRGARSEAIAADRLPPAPRTRHPLARAADRDGEPGSGTVTDWVALYKLARLGAAGAARCSRSPSGSTPAKRTERLEAPAQRMLEDDDGMKPRAALERDRRAPEPAAPRDDGIGEEDHAIPLWFNVSFFGDDRLRDRLRPLLHRDRAGRRAGSTRRRSRRREAVAAAARRRRQPSANPYRGDAAAIAEGQQVFAHDLRRLPQARRLRAWSARASSIRTGSTARTDRGAVRDRDRRADPAGMPPWGAQLGEREDLEACSPTSRRCRGASAARRRRSRLTRRRRRPRPAAEARPHDATARPVDGLLPAPALGRGRAS